MPPAQPAARKALAKIKDETEYYQHQVDGIRRMARMGSFLLADEMGLGKSLQALTVAAIDFEQGWAHRVLVVAPASLKWNWQDEIDLFTKFTSMVLDGTPKQRNLQLEEFEDQGLEVLIVNYEQVKAHAEQLEALGFDIVILDEAHYIKNYKSQRTKAVLALKAKRFFLLTGSPLLNQVDELWPLLHRIAPGQYPRYHTFVHRYAVFGGYKDKQIVGVKNQRELSEALNVWMVRRLKKDVLDLPDKQYIQIKVDFHPTQAKLYQQATEDMLIDLPDNPNPMEIQNALSKFLRLKQICGTAAAIDGYQDHSHKLDRAVELAEEIVYDKHDSPGEHLVVFTQFRMVQSCMKARLESLGIPVFILNGDTPMDQRSEVVKQWAEHKRPAVLVAMLQVAGVGLNMTKANKAIMLDKLFVPKLQEQAEDRLHRIGASTTQPIQIYEMIVRRSIEQRIEAILKGKRKLFDSTVDASTLKKRLLAALVDDDDDD